MQYDLQATELNLCVAVLQNLLSFPADFLVVWDFTVHNLSSINMLHFNSQKDGVKWSHKTKLQAFGTRN